jgi:hypothetical protein
MLSTFFLSYLVSVVLLDNGLVVLVHVSVDASAELGLKFLFLMKISFFAPSKHAKIEIFIEIHRFSSSKFKRTSNFQCWSPRTTSALIVECSRTAATPEIKAAKIFMADLICQWTLVMK